MRHDLKSDFAATPAPFRCPRGAVPQKCPWALGTPINSCACVSRVVSLAWVAESHAGPSLLPTSCHCLPPVLSCSFRTRSPPPLVHLRVQQKCCLAEPKLGGIVQYSSSPCLGTCVCRRMPLRGTSLVQGVSAAVPHHCFGREAPIEGGEE